MPSEWADRYKDRGAERMSQPDPSRWLSQEQLIDGHAVPRWTIGALIVFCFFVGPSSLGYLIMLAVIYLAYTRVYLKGVTFASVKETYLTAAARSEPPKQRRRKHGSVSKRC